MNLSELTKSLNELCEVMEKADKVLEVSRKSKEEKGEKWDRKYINDLPNAAFAVIEKGYKEGGNKSMRHIPHHNKNVKSSTENSSVDLPHYRNGLARINQIKSVSGKESDAALRKRGAAHLEKHRAVLKKSSAKFSESEMKIWKECEELFNNNIKPLLKK